MTAISPHHAHRESKHSRDTKGDRYEIRLSGSGGHGVILAAVILAQAVGSDPKMNVAQTQSYGPEARGGASRADVVISLNDISYPKTMKLDLLLAFTQEACDKYFADLKPDGILLIDNTLVTKMPTKSGYGFPFLRIAREQVGHPMVANIVALGAIAKLSGVVPYQALEAVVRER
ncbi:MAG: 2-oxoacid:acceptor oxidoreductase family protein, partial [candidate division Zixibacteria bacterium]|nr:2-oxoacid:acceptor oxidoreductase family protein [candidate division Zixibacteria bacterium]